MTHRHRSFSTLLVQCETPTPAYHRKYQQEMQAMFEKRLSRAGRVMWGFWTVFGLAQAIFFAVVAVTTYGQLPLWGTAVFIGGAVFGLTFGGLCAWITATGRIQLKSQPPAMAGLAWCFVVLMMTLVLVMAPATTVGVKMIVSTLAFLILGAVFLLASRAEQAELRTKERLLVIEYRLAELAERLPPGGQSK